MASFVQSTKCFAPCIHRKSAVQLPRNRKAQVCCKAEHQGSGLDRREILATLIAGVAASQAGAAIAEPEYTTFFGQDKPPTSYGGYGGTMVETAKYVFEYPASWKSDVINKIEKGTQGIDCRVFNPRNKRQQAFVITLARAGEDNASFRLTDVDSTLSGFAGADYELQDALGEATKVSSERMVEGQLYYDIDIDADDLRYLSTITVMDGKVYAMFVKCPTSLYATQSEAMKHIAATFRTQ